MALKRILSAALLATLLSACAQTPPAASDPARTHHRGDRFQNNHVAFTPRGLDELLAWKWAAMRDGLPRPPNTPTPVVAPDLSFIHDNARAGTAMVPAATWIGHATVLVQAGGLNVLTDPIFSDRASPLSYVGPRRAQPPGLSLAQLPRIDAVVVSHNHYDHCDAESLRALNAQPGGPPLFVVPLGLKAWLAGLGIQNAVELDWWQSQRLGAAEIMLTPVQHWSGRTLTDRMRTLWGGYAVLTPGFNWFHAGDTGYSKDFADIASRLGSRLSDGGFDLALVPIGAYAPRWFMSNQHVDTDEAVLIHRDLRAHASLGMHWGTFELTDEPLDEPPQRLAAARRSAGLDARAFFTLAIGQTRLLSARR
ncbi:MAG: MBL fold metallo-hydrolase [Aquabacterium sp.]